MLLKGRTAIITGGSRGIGKAIAVKLASEGANIVSTYISDNHQARLLEKELLKFKVKAKSYRVDVRDYEKIFALKYGVLRDMGRIDILINNVGIARCGPFGEMSPDLWQEVIDVNLTGVFNMTKAIMPYFIKQKKGDIINIASLSGIVGHPEQINYSASKGGVIAFTKSLAKQVAPFNIRVNAVAPGYIETDMLNDVSVKRKKAKLDLIPMKRFGKPEEVAELVCLLLNENIGYLTGQVISIDGGIGS